MSDRMRGLAVFAAVVDEGSFQAAARRLGQSPAAVSQAVSALEAEAGEALLYRSTRRLGLTERGQAVLAPARALVAAAEAATDALCLRTASPAGTLRLTCPAVLQHRRFAEDLVAFARGFPRVRLEVEFTDTRRNLIRDGFDLALRIGPLDDSRLTSRRVIGGQQVLVAAPGTVTAAAPQALDTVPFVGTPALRRGLVLEGPGGVLVALNTTVQISVDGSHAALSLAMGGAGVALVPRFLARDALDRGDLEEVLPDWRPPGFDLHALWPANAGGRSLTRRFVDLLTRELAANPPLARA